MLDMLHAGSGERQGAYLGFTSAACCCLILPLSPGPTPQQPCARPQIHHWQEHWQKGNIYLRTSTFTTKRCFTGGKRACFHCLSAPFDASGLLCSPKQLWSLLFFSKCLILSVLCILQPSPFQPQILQVGEKNAKPLKLLRHISDNPQVFAAGWLWDVGFFSQFISPLSRVQMLSIPFTRRAHGFHKSPPSAPASPTTAMLCLKLSLSFRAHGWENRLLQQWAAAPF